MVIVFTKAGCMIVATEEDGEQLIQPKENISFNTFNDTIKLRIGTDSDNRWYTGEPGDFTVQGTVPATIAEFITLMGTLLTCGTSLSSLPTAQGWYGCYAGVVDTDIELVSGTNTLQLPAGAKVHFILVDNVPENILDPASDFDYNTGTALLTRGANWITGQKVVAPYFIIPS